MIQQLPEAPPTAAAVANPGGLVPPSSVLLADIADVWQMLHTVVECCRNLWAAMAVVYGVDCHMTCHSV